jgi:hypothetical protein
VLSAWHCLNGTTPRIWSEISFGYILSSPGHKKTSG